MLSLKVYAPVFGDFLVTTTLVNSLPPPFCNDATDFFAIVLYFYKELMLFRMNYLISL